MTISEHGIMLVDDPKNTILALCNIKSQPITWELYKKSYEKIIQRTDKPISRQHTDTHFYILKQFRFISESKEGKYRATQTIYDLCESIENNDNESYMKLLRAILINSEKRKLFEEFLKKFDSDGISEKELTKEFKTHPTKTLIAWCKEAGLIERGKEKYWKINLIEKEPTMELFAKILKDYYLKIRKTRIFGVQRIYVDISELRDAVSARLCIKTEVFDKCLSEVLRKNIVRLRIHGAPPSKDKDLKKIDLFEYGGKVYHYLSIE